MPFINIIQPEEAEGKLKEVYNELENTRGKIADIYKIQSLNPESFAKHMDLYTSVMFGQSPLERIQREMIGVVVSVSNQCRYCIVHHAEAVQHFWNDKKRVEALINNYRQADLSEVDELLCSYARELTKYPGGEWCKESFVTPLKDAGLDDRAILDATQVIGYFNYVNRIVLALGLELENDPGGYRYD